jgi:NitT/TauT family transport system ATP-binding protein
MEDVMSTSQASPSLAVDTPLSVRGISKTYRSKRNGKKSENHVLDDISFDARAGEFVALLGPSGCGKSTVLSAIAGLIDFEGEIAVGGSPIRGPGEERAVVFQHSSLLPWRTLEKNVAYGLELRRTLSRNEIAERVARAIKQVGLEGYEHHYPSQISGGMQQRTNIARALVVEPSLILMDEPFGALDAITREELQDQLSDLIAEMRRTTVFITHDIVEAVYLADTVIVMSARPGRIMTTVKVDFPRPRPRELTDTPEFRAITRELRELLHH